MSKVEAWQHVYTNLEEDQSPSRKGGFQTLFYTKSALAETDIEEIEARLVYFPSDTEPVKRLFFVTSTGRSVIAQIVSLSGSDSLGRRGPYLAHALIFEPDQFSKYHIRPLQVLAEFPFITTIAEALERGDPQTGDIPAIAVSLPEEGGTNEIQSAKNWPREALKSLALSALRAKDLGRDGLTLAFVGESGEVETALRAAAVGVPAPLLADCTFDTYFFRCNPVNAYYWAVGLSECPTSPRFLVVDTRSFQVRIENQPPPQTSFECWVCATISAGDLGLLARHCDGAFALCEWLDDRLGGMPVFDHASDMMINSVFEVNYPKLKRRYQRRLNEQYPAVLVDLVFEEICRRHSPREFLTAIRDGFPPSELLELLYSKYKALGFQRPGRDQVMALDSLLVKVEHRDLRLIWDCWTGQRERLQQDLASLGEGDYRKFAEIARRQKIVEPLSLLISGRADGFLDVVLAPGGVEKPDIVDLVKALLAIAEPGLLNRLVSGIAGCSTSALKALERIVSEHPEVPESFSEAVRAALPDAPQKTGGAMQVIRALFGRRVDKTPKSEGGDPTPS